MTLLDDLVSYHNQQYFTNSTDYTYLLPYFYKPNFLIN